MRFQTFIFFSFSAFYSFSAFGNDCLLSKYQEYAISQKDWQNNLTNLIIRNNSEIKDIANLYRDDQILLIDKNLLGVTLLLDKSPNMLNESKAVSRWLDLDNTKEDKLAKQSSTYRKLLNKKNAIKIRNPHPDGDKLRRVMRNNIITSQEYNNLLSDFRSKVKEINNIKCTAI